MVNNFPSSTERDLLDLFPDPDNARSTAGHFQRLVDLYFSRLSELSGSGTPLFGTFQPQDYAKDRATVMHDQGIDPGAVFSWLMDFVPGSLNSSHPGNLIAPASPPTILSLFSSFVCDHLMPNLAWDVYSQSFARAEIQLSAILSSVLGFNPDAALGLSTYGGAGTNLYGLKVGIEKAKASTSASAPQIVIVTGDSAHMSIRKAAAWLGLGWQSVVQVPTVHGAIDCGQLRDTLARLLGNGYVVGCIVAQMGSTFDFSLDDVAELVRVRDQVCQDFGLPSKPHIHVDAVIGWVYSFFHDYDVVSNALALDSQTLEALISITEKTRTLAYADSVGIDFHKLGFAPLTSSFFILREKGDLQLLAPPGAQSVDSLFSAYGHYEPAGFTLESTRSCAGVMAAYTNCLLFGVAGWQRLLSATLANSVRFRQALAALDFCHVFNSSNPGPAITFRLYPGTCRGAERYRDEQEAPNGASIKSVNEFNISVLDQVLSHHQGAEAGWISINTGYQDITLADGEQISIAALKSYIVSPFTTQAIIDNTVQRLIEAHRVTSQKIRHGGDEVEG